jgi:YD repeat-containing protein
LIGSTLAGTATTHSWDATTNRTSVRIGTGIVTTTTYDALDRARVVVVNDVATKSLPTQDITTETFYDAAGNTVAVRDPRGITTRTIVNARDLARETIADCTDPGTLTPSTNPPSCTGGTATTTANVRTQTTYDGAGNAVKAVSAAGLAGFEATTRTAFDAAGRVQATQDARGTVTRNVYNAAGQLSDTWVNCTDDTASPAPPAGASFWTCDGSTLEDGTFNLYTVFTYDAHGNQATVRQPNGRLTTSLYDAQDRLVTTIDNDVPSPNPLTEDLTTTYGYG